jgi:cytochrome P450
VLAPRAAQIELGARARALLEAHLAGADLAAAVEALGRESRWPAAGPAFFFRLLQPLLCAPERPAAVRRLVGEIVATRIYDRAPPGTPSLRRLLLRRRVLAAFAAERAAGVPAEPRDLIDLVFQCGGEASDALLTEVYAAFLFAMVGSVGFTLGWSLQLACAYDALDAEPAHVVSEALRLFPVAWLLARRPAGDHEVLGHAVTPQDWVVVSPYAIHRNPAHWEAPDRFDPDRWRGRADRSAWLPFGAGPHACVAAPLTLRLVGGVLERLRAGYAPRVNVLDPRPGLGPALAPPSFVLTLDRAA